jgi:hypothetical protein
MVGYGIAYAIPQFLSGIANYNAVQSGAIVMLAGAPMALLMPVTPLLIRHLDVRVRLPLACSYLPLAPFWKPTLAHCRWQRLRDLADYARGASDQILMEPFPRQSNVPQNRCSSSSLSITDQYCLIE